MNAAVEAQLADLAEAWDRAIVANDAEAIGSYMAEDWVIVGSNGSVCDKPTFLGLVRSGTLTHDTMDTEDLQVRVYGAAAAVVLARGVSGGLYRGQAFRERERSSSVFVRQAGEWRCVLTHLSRLGPPPAG